MTSWSLEGALQDVEKDIMNSLKENLHRGIVEVHNMIVVDKQMVI